MCEAVSPVIVPYGTDCHEGQTLNAFFFFECILSYNSRSWDFPGGPVVKTLASSTGGVGSIPGWGIRILHAAGRSQK